MTKEKIYTIIPVIVLVANDLEGTPSRASEMPEPISCSSSLIQHIVETIMTYDAVTSSLVYLFSKCLLSANTQPTDMQESCKVFF